MDKNKSRTDLLAAGRKKLEKFRQKKDNKGGKSNKSSGKAGTDKSLDAASEIVRDRENSMHDTQDNITFLKLNDRTENDTVSTSEELLGKLAIHDTTPAQMFEIQLVGSGLEEATLNQSAQIQHKIEPPSLVSKDSNAVVRQENSPDDSDISLLVDSTSQLKKLHREEQEVGCSGGDQIDGGTVGQSEWVTSTSSNEVVENAGKAIHATDQFIDSDDATLIVVDKIDAVEAQQIYENSADEYSFTESAPVVSSRVINLAKEGSQAEDKNQMLFVSGGSRAEQGIELSPQVQDLSFQLKTEGNEESLGCKFVDLSSGLDGRFIKLSQLAEILKRIDEDKFNFLFKSREASSERFTGREFLVHDTLERLIDELYVASFSRDSFYSQLSEDRKLIDEISETNVILIEEIKQSGNELLKVENERNDLQKNLDFSKAEVEAVSTQVNEMQKKLEIAQSAMSSLSLEIVDCRNLVGAVQAENEDYSDRLEMMADEKKRLSGENGTMFVENNKMLRILAEHEVRFESLQNENINLTETVAFLREERMRLEEEKVHIVSEKSNLHADLAEFRSTLEALEADKKSLNEIFKSVSKDRKRLEEEKELSVLKIMELSKELNEQKDLVVTLQTEISNSHGLLTSIAEEKNMYEEVGKSIFIEYEKQWHDLLETKILEAGFRAEYCKFRADLKEATFQIDHLTEENKFLKIDLEFHKSNVERVVNLGVRSEILTLESNSECQAELSSQEHKKYFTSDDSYGFTALKRHLVDAGVVMQKLEKAIEGMHLNAESLSRSNNEVIAPGISKLIQAFESKSYESELPSKSENQKSEDPYMMTKVVVENLGALLKDLDQDAENASEFCEGLIRTKLHHLVSPTMYQVDEALVELVVVSEILREHTRHAAEKEGNLFSLCDSLRSQKDILQLENSQIREKLDGFQAKTGELQSKLDKIQKDSDEIVASVSNEVKIFKTELADRETSLEVEWNSVVTQVLQAVDKLDSTTKSVFSTSMPGENSYADIVSRVSTSVFCATKLIEELYTQLEAARRDHLLASNAYDDIHEKWSSLQGRNEMAFRTLSRLYDDLGELVINENKNDVKDDKELDPFDPNVFNTLLDKLKMLLSERLQLKSEKNKLELDFINNSRKFDLLKKDYFEINSLLKCVEDVEQSVQLEGLEIDADEPISRMQSIICLLVQKYNEANLGEISSRSLEVQLKNLQGQVEDLDFTIVQYENENLVFMQSLKSVEDLVADLNFKVQEKVVELEQSEQRVSSLREKLSIAVTKGKGLISHRDNLKQSLAETSRELEKCSQELLFKDARLHDLETKLKVFAEAGERMEALESELSYIRNSATALRESFLLKDSVLQRIEETLEDLELPDHFHSRDIIEKVDWLAKSVTGNPLHLGDWEQRSSVGGGSYSDVGFVADGLKEDMPLNSSFNDELRTKYDDSQSKFYGLAEQNEMLEQPLLERNNLVQRWEETLNRVDMSPNLRSMEPEDKIQWFKLKLTEAQNRSNALLEKIDVLEDSCASVSADLQDSRGKFSELDDEFQQACREREFLSRDMEFMSHKNAEISEMMENFKAINDSLQSEVEVLQEQNLQIENGNHHFKSVMRRLQNLVEDALQDSHSDNLAWDEEDIKSFEQQLRQLVKKYRILLFGTPVDTENDNVQVNEKGELPLISRNTDDQKVVILNKELEDAMNELLILKDEKDRYMQNSHSLVREIEELEITKNKLQGLLDQEELKSNSLREKLNIAVRKGKSLVQQRDGMKQVIENLNAEVERLKAEIKHTEKAMFDFEEMTKELSTVRERVKMMEFENSSLKDRLTETERCLQVLDDNLTSVLEAFTDFDLGLASNTAKPIDKLREMGTYFHNMQTSLNSAEQESNKSKRAAELLLAELNEVQERNDILQEDLSKTEDELSELSKEKDLANAAKYEALARVENFSSLLEEKSRQLSDAMVLDSWVDRLKEDLLVFDNELGNVLSKDREVISSISNIMKSFLESSDCPDLSALSPGASSMINTNRKSDDEVFLADFDSLREQVDEHSNLLHEEIFHLSKVMKDIYGAFSSQRESGKSMKIIIMKLESSGKEKESELYTLHENISLLYKACTDAIDEIENWKNLMSGSAMVSRDSERNSNSQIYFQKGQNNVTDDAHIFTKVGIRSIHDKLLFALKDCLNIQNEYNEACCKEMKSTIMSLQKGIQEKDVERDNICMKLVDQIKEAETNAKMYLQDCQQAKVQIHDLQKQVEVGENDMIALKHRVKELQDLEKNSVALQQRVNLLTDTLAAKEQDTETLMQALDEEEARMERLVNKIGELETDLKQKNQDLENLEASRTKALKKLSVTVSKFDELHYLSENLLSEIEKLQSHLQERDGEISFLRQEVTRCTTDALTVAQMNKKSSDEIHGVLTWLDATISGRKGLDVTCDNIRNYQADECKEVLKGQIMALITEMESLRLVVKNNDILLEEERNKVEGLAQKQWHLQNSLRDKESEIVLLQGAGDSVKTANTTSEIVEVDPIASKRASPKTMSSQVRSLRKNNNDQIAIAIDVNHSDDRFDNDDDDKAHGFKSLTTSKIVPRFTRPVSNMVDGLWVSCDRALMRQPVLRLGIIIYWAVLHALLATFVA